MATTDLPGGMSVRTFKPPPDDFDPIKADDRLLLIHGYPRRPDDPDLRERWERVLSRSIHMIEATVLPMPEGRPQVPGRIRPAPDTLLVGNSGTWAGAVVDPPTGASVAWVEGTWNVPNVVPPVGYTFGTWYTASPWVGIDGLDGSGDILHAGVDCDVIRTPDSTSQRCVAWCEWLPGGTFWITNLPVVPGDTVSCLICVDSPTSASIFMYNLTSGVAASVALTAPVDASFLGTSAEWIVERVEIGASGPALARFGDVYFDQAYAGASDHEVCRGGDGYTINLTESGAVLALTTVETRTLIQVKYTGPNA
jgi:hypothetical protein